MTKPTEHLDERQRAALREASESVKEWTEIRNQCIRLAVVQGFTLREVGEAAGLTHTAIAYIIKKKG